jgi:hypothetical protein
MVKKKPAQGGAPAPEPVSLEDNIGLPAAQWRKRNGMSKTEWHRRRKRIAAGEPGSENLLPERIRISPQREIITLRADAKWRAANAVSA